MQNNSIKVIRIVGASSAIAKDYLWAANVSGSVHEFHLYSRSFGFLDSLPLNALNIVLHPFSDFMYAEACDVILNFVGLGSPTRVALESGALELLDSTVDQACTRLLEINTDAVYLYMSSGASYGSNFAMPVSDDQELPEITKFELPRDLYGWVKRCTEVRHRAMPNRKIINLRIFGYASRFLDLEAGFLLSDLANALKFGLPARLSNEVTYRDFINPELFNNVVNFCIAHDLPNTSIDLVSAAPVSKVELVQALIERYGLDVEWENLPSGSKSIAKQNYFSISSRLRDYGLVNLKSALEMVIEEFDALIGANPKSAG